MNIPTIHDVIGRVSARNDVWSGRGLCALLCVGDSQWQKIKRGEGFVSDATMVRISDAAGIPREEGLALLNIWRSEGDAAATYRLIYQRLIGEVRPTVKSKTHREQINISTA